MSKAKVVYLTETDDRFTVIDSCATNMIKHFLIGIEYIQSDLQPDGCIYVGPHCLWILEELKDVTSANSHREKQQQSCSVLICLSIFG